MAKETELRVVLKKPHSGQQVILDNRKRFNVMVMGRRWGKTEFGIQLAVETVLQGGRVGWYSPTHKTVADTFREFSETLAALIETASVQAMRMTFKGGGSIDFWALEHDPDASRGRGYDRVIIDEAALSGEHLRLAWSRVIRPTLIVSRGDAYFMSTPRGRNYLWELHLFALKPENSKDWAYFHAPTSSNPLIHPDEIESMRRDAPSELDARQEIDAEFIEGEGLFFTDFTEKDHVCFAKDIPSHWRWFAGFDWGYEAPSCLVLFAVDEHDTVYAVDEWYARGFVDEEQADACVALIRKYGIHPPSLSIYADTGMWGHIGRSQGMGKRPVDAFYSKGLNMIKATKDRVAGWRAMRSLMRVPGNFYCFKGRTTNLIREIIDATRDPKDIEDTNAISDHALDAARYALIQWRPVSVDPDAPIPEPPPDHRPQWLKDKDRRSKDWDDGTANPTFDVDGDFL